MHLETHIECIKKDACYLTGGLLFSVKFTFYFPGPLIILISTNRHQKSMRKQQNIILIKTNRIQNENFWEKKI